MPDPLKLWILISTICFAAGWILSAIKELNACGYAGLFAAVGIVLVLARRAHPREPTNWGRIGRKLRRRFRRGLPLGFALVALMAAIGGAIYAPNNYDALMYRLPRMLHWVAEGRWHWIESATLPMNRSGTGMEWLMTPLFVFTDSDRLFFLIDVLNFLLLPGAIFAMLTAAGAARRVAWAWMWCAPMGYCFVLQAGSIGNDTLQAPYVLAAMAYGLRAWRKGDVRLLRWAILAAGLATGVKNTTLPLLLPMACAIAPAWRLLKEGVLKNVAIAGLAGLVSFLPNAVLNQIYGGSWAGDPQNTEHLVAGSPAAGIIGNVFEFGTQLLQPPILPAPLRINRSLENLVPTGVRQMLAKDFPRFTAGLAEMPREEASGLGLAAAGLIVASIIGAWRLRRRRDAGPGHNLQVGWTLAAASWLALAVYMAKIAADPIGRLIASYFPVLLLPVALMTGQEAVVRQRWWNRLAVLSIAMAGVALVLTPSRPLYPAVTAARVMEQWFPQSEFAKRAREVYEVYAARSDSLAAIRAHLPASAKIVGLITGDGAPESVLWRPYGSRRVINLEDHNRRPPMEWVVVNNGAVASNPSEFEDWLRRTGGHLVAQQIIVERVTTGPGIWSLVRFEDPRLQSGRH